MTRIAVTRPTAGLDPLASRIELSTSAVLGNITALREHLPTGTALAAVIKGNAYGHGREAVAAMLDGHVDLMAVADPTDAVELADQVSTRVLSLGPAHGDVLAACCSRGVAVTVSNAAQLPGLPPGARVHLLVDTGLHRLGLEPAEAAEVAERVRAAGAIVEAAYCMVAHADQPDWPSVTAEISHLRNLALAPLVHTGGSSVVLERPDLVGDIARTGLALLGYYPRAAQRPLVRLEPCLRWIAPVLELRTLPSGARVGYQGVRLNRPTTVATLPVGTAHGLHPRADARAGVEIKGVHCSYLCPPSLDYALVDATDVSAVSIGTEATILGGAFPALTSVEHVAAALGSLVDHILVGIDSKIPRVVVD